MQARGQHDADSEKDDLSEDFTNGKLVALISEASVQRSLCSLLDREETWQLLKSCYDTYRWGDIMTFNTPAQRDQGTNLVESDLSYAAAYRLWGYNHS